MNKNRYSISEAAVSPELFEAIRKGFSTEANQQTADLLWQLLPKDDDLVKLLSSSAMSFLKAYDRKTGEILGVLAFEGNRILTLVVLKKARGCGLGKALIETYEKEQNGCIYVHSEITAVGFYASCGFEEMNDPSVKKGRMMKKEI